MNTENILQRIDELLAIGKSADTNANASHRDHALLVTTGQQLLQGALSLMVNMYNKDSAQADSLLKEVASINTKWTGSTASEHIIRLAMGTLHNLKGEIQAGLVGSLQRQISAGVLTDFLSLSKLALEEKGDDAKNVAAVLAAALFEDTIRKLAESNGIQHIDKLQDVITALKNKGVLQPPQLGIANAYLNFRNHALHAEWDKIERAAVASVQGFVEELLLKHFS